MHQGTYVFSQLMGTAAPYQLNQYINRYSGNRRVKKLSCREQFLAMSFGQLSFRESLRDIVTCLAAHSDKQYHLGFRQPVARSTLADANEKRDWPNTSLLQYMNMPLLYTYD